MKKHTARLIVFAVLIVSLAALSHGQQITARVSPVPLWPGPSGDFSQHPDQYVFFDPPNREWVVYFPEDLSRPLFSRKIELRFGSRAEVKPELASHVERLADGTYSYTYTVQNLVQARTPIEEWVLIVPRRDETLSSAHPGWGPGVKGTRIVPLMNPGAVGPNRMVELVWAAPNSNSLIGRGNASGLFSVRSAFAPGFTLSSASGRANRAYDAQIAASLPKPVADQLATVMAPAWNARQQVVIGPWFASDAPLSYIAANFGYGIQRLSHSRVLDHNSAFVKGAMETFEAFQQSQAESFLDPDRMDFLSNAAPGLESEIANAIRLTLTR